MSSPTQQLPGTAAEVELDAGQRIGEYEIAGKLGQGAFGTVYKASNPLIGKLVAIDIKDFGGHTR